MKQPFAKIKIGERFLCAGEIHEKDGVDHCIQISGSYRGQEWYIWHDDDFPDFEMCVDGEKCD